MQGGIAAGTQEHNLPAGSAKVAVHAERSNPISKSGGQARERKRRLSPLPWGESPSEVRRSPRSPAVADNLGKSGADRRSQDLSPRLGEGFSQPIEGPALDMSVLEQVQSPCASGRNLSLDVDLPLSDVEIADGALPPRQRNSHAERIGAQVPVRPLFDSHRRHEGSALSIVTPGSSG